MNAETTGPCLIAEEERTFLGLDLVAQSFDRLRGIFDFAEIANLTPLRLRDGNRHGFLMHVQADEFATIVHDLPPQLWL